MSRSTDCWVCDTAQTLTREQQFDDAERLCRWQRARFVPGEDQYARWTVEMVRVLAAKQLAATEYSESTANAPIRELLADYPEHRRRLFLEAAVLTTRYQFVEASVAQVALARHDDTMVNQTISRLVRYDEKVKRLRQRVADQLGQLAGNRDVGSTLPSDLRRLEQQLLVDHVKSSLLLTELFPAGGDEFVAAARKAESACDQALAKLTPSSKASIQIRRMRIEAMIRQGDLDRTRAQWDQLRQTFDQPWSSDLWALSVRVDLMTGRLDRAKQTIQDYDAGRLGVGSSLRMDLAKLQWLLSSSEVQSASTSIDQIETRWGIYARRRAEGLAMAMAKHVDAPELGIGLAVTRGLDLIRRGELELGAQLLSDAADREPNPDTALEHAITAAAALQSARRPGRASKVLEAISTRHPAAARAGSAHLQSIVLRGAHHANAHPSHGAGHSSKTSAGELESLLRKHLESWPQDPSTPAARQWLMELLIRRGDFTTAAVVATKIGASELATTTAEPNQLLDRRVERCLLRWKQAFDSVEPAKQDSLRRTAAAAFEQAEVASFLHEEFLATTHRWIAAVYLDISQLNDLPSPVGLERRWVTDLLKFRLALGRETMTDRQNVSRPDDEWVDAVRERLKLDALANRSIRLPLAKMMWGWETREEPSLEKAQLQLWQGQQSQAVETLDQLLAGPDSSAETLIAAATLLGQEQPSACRQKAVEYWDRLAAGSTKDSDLWHLAKRSAIGLLRQLGEDQEADKRIRYLLLTTHGMDDSIRAQYQQDR